MKTALQAESGYPEITGLWLADLKMFQGNLDDLLSHLGETGITVVTIRPVNNEGGGGGSNNGNFDGGGGGGGDGKGKGEGEQNNGNITVFAAVGILGTMGLCASGGYVGSDLSDHANPVEAARIFTLESKIIDLQTDIVNQGGTGFGGKHIQPPVNHAVHHISKQNVLIVQHDITEMNALQAQLPNGHQSDMYASEGVGVGLTISLILFGCIQAFRHRRKPGH